MTSSTSSSSVAAALAALVVPALLVGGALASLGRAEPTSEASAVPPEVAACLDTLRKGDEVLLVGNSKSGTDIDRAQLARTLGVKQVAKVGGPGSSAPLWYASVERCAYEAGHTPKLLLVYGVAGALLRTTLGSELERLNLAPYLAESEPVLEAKVFGGKSSPFWNRVRERKTTIVLGVQHGVRDLVAGLFFAAPGEGGLLERGRAVAEPALAEVLGEAAGEDATARHRAIPIAEAGAGDTPGSPRTVEDTLVPDLVALAKTHGTRVVFVLAPLAASKVDTYDRADPALVRATVEALNAAGAGFVDLTTLNLPASAYGDGIHMNASGRARLTEALGERLLALDALGATAFGAAALPRPPPTVRREGTPPALPALGPLKRGPHACGWQAALPGLAGASDAALGRAGLSAASPILVFEDGAPLKPHAKKDEFDNACAGAFTHQNGVIKLSPSGGPAEVAARRAYTVALSDAVPLRDPFGRDAWWVYPGTTLVVESSEGWDTPIDGFAVAVEAHVAIPGERGATVRVGDQEAPLDGALSVARASVPVSSPRGPWRVEVRSPADGPWLLVRRVVAGTEEAPWYALGTPDEGRVVNTLQGELSVAADPPALGSLGAIVAAKAGGWRVDSSALGAPNADEVYRATGISACSPLVLREDGAPLAVPNAPMRLVGTTPGAWTHSSFGIFFSTSDGTAPAENGRVYTAVLNPQRPCRTGRWVYPGDRVTLAVPDRLLGRLVEGASRLHLTAAAFGGDASAALTVRLFVGDTQFLAASTPTATLAAAPPRFPLDGLVRPDATGVRVELSTPPGAPFVMVSGLDLAEPPEPIF